MNVSALAGALILRPGAGGAAIGNGRPALAGALLRGRPAAEAALILPRVFSLCGQAHRLTAGLAVGAAMGAGAGAAGRLALASARAELAGETLREHVRRLLIDWPRLLGRPDQGAAALRSCPLFGAPAKGHNSDNGAAARDWVARELLGEPVAPWLASWRADRDGGLRRWSARAHTLPARLLRAVEDDGGALGDGGPALRAHASEASMRALAAQMVQEAAFERAPSVAGVACETGCWTRLGEDCGAAPASICLRLGARVAEVCALVEARPARGTGRPGSGGDLLACGALALGEGEALAWTEMARGVLCHWVRLVPGAQPKIGDYRVVAPTEWNFHPRGAVARALAAMPAGGDAATRAATARRIGVLVAAFDPCVHFEIEFAHA